MRRRAWVPFKTRQVTMGRTNARVVSGVACRIKNAARDSRLSPGPRLLIIGHRLQWRVRVFGGAGQVSLDGAIYTGVAGGSVPRPLAGSRT
jgi:hypothetical protein